MKMKIDGKREATEIKQQNRTTSAVECGTNIELEMIEDDTGEHRKKFERRERKWIVYVCLPLYNKIIPCPNEMEEAQNRLSNEYDDWETA